MQDLKTKQNTKTLPYCANRKLNSQQENNKASTIDITERNLDKFE